MKRTDAMFMLGIMKLGFLQATLQGEDPDKGKEFMEAIDFALNDMQSIENISNMIVTFPTKYGRKNGREDEEE